MKLLLFNNQRKVLSRTGCMKLSTLYLKPPWDVLFFGTDNFSLASLQTLHKEFLAKKKVVKSLEVVTTAKNGYVKKYALEHSLPLHSWPLQPQSCRGGFFQIGVVVSFGHLIPKSVIEQFPLGMVNVHASLLPRWRGAAPIIHTLAAGDTTTGVTIMKILPHRFDVGEIIQQETVSIHEQMRMPELHTLLAQIGARNLLEVLRVAPRVLHEARAQDSQEATFAPRVNATMAHVDLEHQTARELYNLSRALTGLYPLVLNLHIDGKVSQVRLHRICGYSTTANSGSVAEELAAEVIGSTHLDRSCKQLKIKTKHEWIYVDRIGLPGKRVMNAVEFSNGYLKQNSHVVFTSAK